MVHSLDLSVIYPHISYSQGHVLAGALHIANIIQHVLHTSQRFCEENVLTISSRGRRNSIQHLETNSTTYIPIHAPSYLNCITKCIFRLDSQSSRHPTFNFFVQLVWICVYYAQKWAQKRKQNWIATHKCTRRTCSSAFLLRFAQVYWHRRNWWK